MASTVVKHLWQRVSLHARLIAAVFVLCMLLVGLDGWRTWQNRSRVIAEDKVETANLVKSLAQHAHDAIAVADNAVFAIRDRLELGSGSAAKIERVHTSLEAQVNKMPGIEGLFIFDVNGNWIASSDAITPRHLNNSSREYFQYHQSHTAREVHLGGPIRSGSNDRWVITVSHRVDDAAGNFAGVVLTTILADRLQAYYDTFNVGSRGVISLATATGIIIARSPSASGGTGSDISSSLIFSRYLPLDPMGSFEYVSPLDGVKRIGSYRRIDEYPLFLIVSHGMDDVLADWRSDAALHLAISVGAAVILVLFGLRIAGQVERQQAAERLYRLLAANSSDAIMCVGMDGRRRYVSPAFTVLTGWTAAEAMQVRFGELVYPDDQHRADAIRAELLAGCKQVTMEALIGFRGGEARTGQLGCEALVREQKR